MAVGGKGWRLNNSQRSGLSLMKSSRSFENYSFLFASILAFFEVYLGFYLESQCLAENEIVYFFLNNHGFRGR